MKNIVTVLGEIPSDTLGFCHCHEHLSIDRCEACLVDPSLLIDDESLTAMEMNIFCEAGGRAVVDAQPVGCGRNAGTLRALSEASGVHIIASTGFHKMLYYPSGHWIFSQSRSRLAEVFVQELESGMFADADTDEPIRQQNARAGIIKTAIESGSTDDGQYRKLLGAVSDAAKSTGAAVMAHIEKQSDPLALADFFQSSGVKPDRLIFCHMDRTIPDLAMHRELCDRGIYMEYDTIGRPKYHDDEAEIGIVLDMISSGHEERLLMGLDVTRNRMRSYGGNVGLDYILRFFIPQLLKNGVSQDTIDRIFIGNPATVLAR
jgi:phosphotriesterase-related protein